MLFGDPRTLSHGARHIRTRIELEYMNLYIYIVHRIRYRMAIVDIDADNVVVAVVPLVIAHHVEDE